MPGSQDFADDPRNANALLWLNGALIAKHEAKVSVFDAGFTMGDGVWEGLRVHKGALLFLDAHLDRLTAGAAQIALDIGMSRAALTEALTKTCAANGMTDGAHLRLMVTRGEKRAVNQDPRNALGVPTVVIVAEYKLPSAEVQTKGLVLATSKIRCSGADTFDMRLNSHSRLNLIAALLEAIEAGADEALMRDQRGFISSCNATNFFWVRDGELRTSSGAYCFNGVTRANVIALARANAIPLRLGDFPLEDVHGADEAFVTGTFGGLTPVRSIDKMQCATTPGPLTLKLRALYEALKDKDVKEWEARA